MHSAAFSGSKPLVWYLLHQGADPTIRDREFDGTSAGWAEYAELKDLLGEWEGWARGVVEE